MNTKTDQLFERYKKILLIPAVILAAIALWHYTYVRESIAATGDGFLSTNYMQICVAMLGLSLAGGIMLFCTEYRFEHIWIFAVLALGICCMRVMPGLSGPDEPTHYITAYAISDKLMFMDDRDDQGLVYVRTEDFKLEDMTGVNEAYRNGQVPETEILGQDLSEKTYRDVENWPKGMIRGNEMTTSNRIGVVTTPIFYMPQALGITLARLLHLNALWTVKLGRFFNLLVYAVFVYLGLCLMPFGKKIMAAAALLPMTIELSASLSYDAMLIALSFFFTGFVLHLAYEKEKVSLKDVAVLSVVIALIAPCKMVYTILILLLLFIPKEKFEKRSHRIILWGASAVLILISMLLVNSQVIASYAQATESELVWAGGEAGWTISYALHNPLQTVRICYNTLMWQGGYWFTTMLGGYLGNADPTLDVPFVLQALMTVCLLAAGLKNPENTKKLTTRDMIITGIMILLLGAMLMGSMLVGWTTLSSPQVLGVQGRYLLPVLPMAVLLLRNTAFSFDSDKGKEAIYFMLLLDGWAFIRLFSMVCLKV